MIVLYILLGIFGLLLLLLLIPAGVDVHYEQMAAVRLRYGPLGFGLPGEKKKKKDKPPVEKKAAAAPVPKKEKEPSSVVEWLQDIRKSRGLSGLLEFFTQLLKIFSRSAGHLVKYITMPRADLCMVVRGEDAAETAVMYGRLCASVYPAFELLCRLKPCRHPRISIVPDYGEGKTEAVLSVSLRIIPLLVVKEGLVLLCRALWTFLKYRPAGAEKAPAKAEQAAGQ